MNISRMVWNRCLQNILINTSELSLVIRHERFNTTDRFHSRMSRDRVPDYFHALQFQHYLTG